ncbi:MAG: TIM barrel protein [Spirochaetes bacterium]|nr:TIM barrel protein [Spirochaetota bacterium]
MKSYKNRFPFAVGAPSYIIPVKADSVVANARFLAGFLDMVQLLLFGRDHLDEVMSPRIIRDLRKIGDDSGLRFTVHLPADLALLGASKEAALRSLDVIERILDATGVLGVEGYVLHVDSGPERVELTQSWREEFSGVLGIMAERLGDAARDIYLENTSYDLMYFGDIVNDSPFPVCMDAGHLMFHGHDGERFMELFGSRIRQVHMHGVGGGKDHRAISAHDVRHLKFAGKLLMKMAGSLVIEVYNRGDLEQSLRGLEHLFEIDGQARRAD